MPSIDDFNTKTIQTREAEIFVRWAGSGPPVLLLHGFPETHLMWRHVAPLLSERLTVVLADLRGYGRSSCPRSTEDHAPYSKRAMALDMISVMEQLGFERFAVAGHDRGGRVAYRMALDHPDRISHLAVLDVLPIETVWSRADSRLALSFWPWSLFAQAEPLPERILKAVPDAVIDDALGGWGSSPKSFPEEVRSAYVKVLGDAEHAHAICEEYRAAATIDREHDKTDLASGRRITCPLLVLWSASGALDTWYVNEGGPLALWKEWTADVQGYVIQCNKIQGHAIKGGHFFPEENPLETAEALETFFQA
jgi:haloacetate dehalogenase